MSVLHSKTCSKRLQTDYIDLGMIHYIDSEEEWEQIQHSDYMDYVMEFKKYRCHPPHRYELP